MLPSDPLEMWELLKLPEAEQIPEKGSGKAFHSHAAPLGLKRSFRRMREHDSDAMRFEVDTYSGVRNGRRVQVMPRTPRSETGWRWELHFGLESQVRVFGKMPRFAARSRGGRLRLSDGDALAARAIDEANAAGHAWRRTSVTGGEGEIRVYRKLGMLGARGFHDWVYDLWLAETLAARLAR